MKDLQFGAAICHDSTLNRGIFHGYRKASCVLIPLLRSKQNLESMFRLYLGLSVNNIRIHFSWLLWTWWRYQFKLASLNIGMNGSQTIDFFACSTRLLNPRTALELLIRVLVAAWMCLTKSLVVASWFLWADNNRKRFPDAIVALGRPWRVSLSTDPGL